MHDYDLTNDGFASSIPYLVQFCVAVTACIAVGILTEKNLIVLVLMSFLVIFLHETVKFSGNLNLLCTNLSKIRKFCGFVGLMPGCLLLCLINVVGCNTQAVVVFLTISSGFMGLSGAAL